MLLGGAKVNYVPMKLLVSFSYIFLSKRPEARRSGDSDLRPHFMGTGKGHPMLLLLVVGCYGAEHKSFKCCVASLPPIVIPYTITRRSRMRQHKGNAKLLPVQAIEICRLYSTGQWTQSKLARKFGISSVQIGRIVRGEVWADVTGMGEEVEWEDAQAETPPPIIQKYTPAEPITPDMQAAADASMARFAAKQNSPTANEILRCKCKMIMVRRTAFPFTDSGVIHHFDKECEKV